MIPRVLGPAQGAHAGHAGTVCSDSARPAGRTPRVRSLRALAPPDTRDSGKADAPTEPLQPGSSSWTLRGCRSGGRLARQEAPNQHRAWHRSAETVLPLQQACFQGLDRAFSAPFDPDPFFEPKYQSPEGAVEQDHLQGYLDEFAFRFNRRRSEFRGLLFRRLLEQAVQVDPVTYRSLVVNPSPKRTKPRLPAKRRAAPPSLAITSPPRPWRERDRRHRT